MSESAEKNIEKTQNDELKIYELGYHILPSVAEENLGAEVSKIKDIVEDAGGHFIGEEGSPKMIRLAYQMTKKIDNKLTKFQTAYFGWIKFESSGEVALEIEKNLKSLNSVLRFILINSVRISSMVANTSRPKRVEKAEEDGEISEVEVDKAIDELIVE